MTQKDKKELKRNIEELLKRSYIDDGNSYELEFREMLEIVANEWDEIVTPSKVTEEKQKLTVIYGEEACNYWDLKWDSGLECILKDIDKKGLGDFETYEFDTEHDRELAKEIVALAAGCEEISWDER